MRSAYSVLFCLIACFVAATPSMAAEPDGRQVALVSEVQADAAARLPVGYSPDALRRELEVALESTGLFIVPTRERGDIDPVRDELARGHRAASAPMQRANLILNPTVETFVLRERRRPTPMMRGKDSVSASGQAALTVLVLEAASGHVQARMQIDVRFQTRERVADPLAEEPEHESGAFDAPASVEEYRAFYQEIGRAFAKRVLDQVSPTLVAQRSADLIYLTRGEDAGYRVGEMLKVMRRGPEIRHPVTHQLLDREDEEIGQAKVTEVRPRVTVAKIVSATREIQTGDIVREQPESEN
jgi:hypothetical protein